MNRFFGYIRVSTAKQGEGVSLAEQKEAIERFAAKDGLQIVRWFEELETAAKRGRPAFSKMLAALSKGEAAGVIIHKIDRSARNLRDWADLGELIDRGIAVHFAAEGLDLGSRGGRLSADIQAVVAADYIRNLREETRKGFYGRLKQGIWPLAAPLGYVDQGGGKVKTIDPVKGPLVRQAFELYDTGRFGLISLCAELHRRGLRNKTGGKVSRSGLSAILNNPFYIGLLYIKKSNETFEGAHEPLVPVELFKRVKRRLKGKSHAKPPKNDFLFRRRVKCAECQRTLVGESQKGHVYYRCHDRVCPVKCVREEVIDEALRNTFRQLRFSDQEKAYLSDGLEKLKGGWKRHAEEVRAKGRLEIGKVQARLEKLTDAFLDGAVERELYETRKAKIFAEKRRLEERVGGVSDEAAGHVESLRKHLERADMALHSYNVGDKIERRDLIKLTTSNLRADQKKGYVELYEPFATIANRQTVHCGVLPLTRPRSLPFLSFEAESEDEPDRLRAWRLIFRVFEALEELQSSD